ncbi:MerR family transcriptional regulator [Bacteroidales bacterium OttesenSCG-928-K03]|nr:MerR family transcriptional regulator [Odoribacter sp. OttesenSCG-928-L07]MDL2239523.1 MerR family transcriptional regulator [Bacteroidales bacterium OttesenSCG-928-L14]MDL2242214.1 MerR family transcriptional regulator [Bacteroidales bacterium OttesenSCG-928-K03]
MEGKLYYTISEVAEKFNLSQSLIRFWETEFPKYIQPKRNKRGVRYYTAKDIDNIEKIHTLVKKQKYTLEGARKALKSKIPLETGEQQEVIAKVESIDITDKDIIVREKLIRIKELAEKLLAEE